MAHSAIGNIVLNPQEVHTVDGDSSVEGVMDSVITHVRRVHSADHMEVNGIGAKDEGLADIGEFNAVDSSRSRFISRRVHDNHSTVLVVSRCWITLVLYVS